MFNINKLLLVLLIYILSQSVWSMQGYYKLREDKTKCPQVKVIRHFELEELLGKWYVVQYYASSEEAVAYSCMQADLTISPSDEITMNFTYIFVDDPIRERLIGNITWQIPDIGRPAHWTHAEDIYEGVYNTYVLDSDYKSWALLLHCAEKSGSTRYLSSIIMSRQQELGPNVISYLREKLPRYDIDLQYMFTMEQNDCDGQSKLTPRQFTPTFNEETLNKISRRQKNHRRHPLRRKFNHFLKMKNSI